MLQRAGADGSVRPSLLSLFALSYVCPQLSLFCLCLPSAMFALSFVSVCPQLCLPSANCTTTSTTQVRDRFGMDAGNKATLRDWPHMHPLLADPHTVVLQNVRVGLKVRRRKGAADAAAAAKLQSAALAKRRVKAAEVRAGKEFLSGTILFALNCLPSTDRRSSYQLSQRAAAAAADLVV